MKEHLENRTNRIIERLKILGTISDDKNGIARFFGSPAHTKAKQVVMNWMEAAGMTVSCDNIGNARGILHSANINAKHLVIGSHYDTVFDAGKYDGPLGILLGIEMVQHITDNDIKLPFHLNIVAFADEEGGRFNTAYLGSSVLAGNFDDGWLSRQDEKGISLQTVIENTGGTIANIANDKIPQKDWLGYYEIHIEQGPVLCQEDLPVCLVSGIAGQTRVDIKWTGMAGHAGTSPMSMRKDALCAAAEFTLAVEALGLKHKEKLVATVGKIIAKPNSSNVIPGFVYCSLDIRSMDDAFLAEKVEELSKKANQIAKARNLVCSWQVLQSNSAVECDAQLKDTLRAAIKKTDISRLLEIPSGAGHDGVMIAQVAPISMLFVRCRDGISHNPLEYSDAEDIKAALAVGDHFLKELKSRSKNN